MSEKEHDSPMPVQGPNGNGNGNGAESNNGTSGKLLWWIISLMSVLVVGFFANLQARLSSAENINSVRGERITALEGELRLIKENQTWIWREIDKMKIIK